MFPTFRLEMQYIFIYLVIILLVSLVFVLPLLPVKVQVRVYFVFMRQRHLLFFCFVFFLLMLRTFPLLALSDFLPLSFFHEASSSAPAQELPILEGRPVSRILEGRPAYTFETIWGTPAEALYFPTQVHVPAEIDDPLIIDLVGRLNGYILYLEDLSQELTPAISQAIQAEINRAPEASLAATLQHSLYRPTPRKS